MKTTNIKDKARLHGLHNLFDLTTEFKRALFLNTTQGFFTKDMFLSDVDWTEETVVYIMCDEEDEKLLGYPYVNEARYILVQGMLLDGSDAIGDVYGDGYYVRSKSKWKKIRAITTKELDIIFGHGYYGGFSMHTDLGFIVGIGTWDE